MKSMVVNNNNNNINNNQNPIIPYVDYPDIDTYEVEEDGFLEVHHHPNDGRCSSLSVSSSSMSSSFSFSTSFDSSSAETTTASYVEDEDFIIMVNSTEQRKMKKQQQKAAATAVGSGNTSDTATSLLSDGEQKQINAKAIAAGITTGSISLFIGGPIIATIVAFGTKYVAQNDTMTPIGEAARNIGEIALDVTEKMKEIDEKHYHFSSNANKKVHAINKQYGIIQKSNILINTTKRTVAEMDDEHQITNKLNVLYHQEKNILSILYYNTACRINFMNDKYGISNKLNHLWYQFEKNILLTDDSLLFEKHIQYLHMERQLEQEELELRQHNNIN